MPGAYKLWLAADDSFRLSQNIVSGMWTLRQGRAKLARARLGHAPTLEPFEGMLAYDGLALLLCLAIETMRCEASLVRVRSGDGGGGR